MPSMTVTRAKAALGFMSAPPPPPPPARDSWPAVVSRDVAKKRLKTVSDFPNNKSIAVLKANGESAEIIQAKATVLTSPATLSNPYKAVIVTTTLRQTSHNSLNLQSFKLVGTYVNPSTGNQNRVWMFIG